MNEIAGWITIGTKLDNQDLKKDLVEQKRELQRAAKEQERLLKQKAKIEMDLSQIEVAQAALKKVASIDLEVAKTEEERNQIMAEYNQKVEILNAGYAATNRELDEINRKIGINAENTELIRGRIVQIKNDLKRNNGWEEVKKSIDKSSKSLSGMIGKMGKYALTIVGIRSAYSAIRSAMSTISQYDKQLAKDMEYIRYALSMTIKPVVEWLVKAIYQILMAIGGAIKSLTGFNIFSNASAKNMKSMANSAKEIDKSLADFDEANILNDPSKNGLIVPSFDLSVDNVFAGLDLDYYVEKGKEMAQNVAKGINNFFEKVDFKELAEWVSRALRGVIQTISEFIKNINWKQVGQDIMDFLLGLDWAGLGGDLIDLIFDGLVATVELASGVIDSIIKALTDPQFWEKLKGLGTTLLEKIFEGMSKLNDAMGTSLEKLWDEIVDWILDQLGLEGNIKEIAKAVAEVIGKVLRYAVQIILFGPIIGGGSVLGDLLGMLGITEKETQAFGGEIMGWLSSGLKYATKTTLFGPIGGIVSFIKDILGVHSPSTVFESIGENLMLGLENGVNDKAKKIENQFTTIGENLIANLKKGIMKNLNGIIDLINSMITNINKSLSFKWNNITVGGIKLLSAGSVNVGKIPTITRLATGGIVDVPRTGASLNDVRVGEKGREGVLPLTNPETMSELGREIAKWIPINLDITNTIDGRVLNKRLEQINANNSFARNGAI